MREPPTNTDADLLQQMLAAQLITNTLLRKLNERGNLDEQNRILRNIRSHIRIMAWCVFLALMFAGCGSVVVLMGVFAR